jgi:hypothetical protein
MERIQGGFFKEVSNAIKQGQLPAWFESKVTNG